MYDLCSESLQMPFCMSSCTPLTDFLLTMSSSRLQQVLRHCVSCPFCEEQIMMSDIGIIRNVSHAQKHKLRWKQCDYDHKLLCTTTVCIRIESHSRYDTGSYLLLVPIWRLGSHCSAPVSLQMPATREWLVADNSSSITDCMTVRTSDAIHTWIINFKMIKKDLPLYSYLCLL